MKNNYFTLIEVMIVVAIIAILAAVAIPSLQKNRESATKQTQLANIKIIKNSIAVFLSNNPSKARADISSFDDIKVFLSEGSNREQDFFIGSQVVIVTDSDVYYE